MHIRPSTTSIQPSSLLRSLAVLLACAGLAGVSLAAAAGPKASAERSDPGAAVAAAALTHRGDAYTWGAAGPKTWDCSGLTSTLWREVGGVASIPRVARDQQAWALPLPAEQVLPGDLIFFGDPATHVGIVERRVSTSSRTDIEMVDASSSRQGVVERRVWTTGVVRFGRVPRPRMVPVTPWQQPTVPSAQPAQPTSTVGRSPLTLPVLTLPALTLPALTLPPASLNLPGSAIAVRAASLARNRLGDQHLTDLSLIRLAWLQAGGPVLPTTRERLLAASVRVDLRDARIGDLISYGAPYSHVGIYEGSGRMVDASRALGKVVERPVWASPSLVVLRLPTPLLQGQRR